MNLAEQNFEADELRPLLLVVIDDDLAVLSGMEMLLSSYGHEIVTSDFSGGYEDEIRAISNSCDRVPDLIIADYRLPQNWKGTDIIINIRDEFKAEIPAIIITGDVSIDLESDALENNYTVLHKPVATSELMETISKCVKNS